MPTSTPSQFKTNILPGFHPDPSIVHHPTLGYFICTSTFEFWPGLPIYHSTDLINWKLIGHAVNRRSQGVDLRTVEANGGLFAPTLRFWKGRFVVTCACVHQRGVSPRGFYVWTDNIFDDLSWGAATFVDELGIDQDLFFDDDDRCYLSVARRITEPEIPVNNFHCGVYTCEIDIKTGNTISPSKLARVSPTGCAEGSHIFKKDGWYFMIVAEGGTEIDHQEWIMRAKHPMGPWELPPTGINPILHNGTHPEIQQTGHADLVQTSSGDWFIVFLGVRPVGLGTTTVGGLASMASTLGRETFMAPVAWKEGWPIVNSGKPIAWVAEAYGVPTKTETPNWNFQSETKLDLGWYTARTPLKPFYTILLDHSIALRGGPYLVTEHESASMLLRKQPSFSADWQATLDWEGARPGEESGIIVWNRSDAYASLGVRGSEGGGMELCFRTAAEGDPITVAITREQLPVKLRIEARPKVYSLLYQLQAGSFERIGSVKSSSLLPLFTGAFLGIYSHGDGTGRPCQTAAIFSELSMANM